MENLELIFILFQGNLLVSASVCDRTMYVWDVSMEVAVPLQKYGGGIPVLVSWSPTSEHVFASTTNILFRFVIFILNVSY